MCDLQGGTCAAQDGVSAVPLGKKTPAQFGKKWARGAQGLLDRALAGRAEPVAEVEVAVETMPVEEAANEIQTE